MQLLQRSSRVELNDYRFLPPSRVLTSPTVRPTFSGLRVAAVNFLQLLLVSRRGLLTSISTCWRSLTTVQLSKYWIGGTITNQCIRRQLLSPTAFSGYKQFRYSGRGAFQLPGVLSRNRGSSPSKSSLDQVTVIFLRAFR